MAELWSFENVGSRTLTYVTTESSSKSKSIWPIMSLLVADVLEIVILVVTQLL